MATMRFQVSSLHFPVSILRWLLKCKGYQDILQICYTTKISKVSIDDDKTNPAPKKVTQLNKEIKLKLFRIAYEAPLVLNTCHVASIQSIFIPGHFPNDLQRMEF